MRPVTGFLGAVAALLLAAAVFVRSDGASSAEPAVARAQAPPSSPLVCYQAATEQTALDENQAQSLCQGSRTPWPVRCYEAAQDETALSENRAITLCQCARSLQPVTCYERADDDTDLSEHELVQMCRATVLHAVTLPHCTPQRR